MRTNHCSQLLLLVMTVVILLSGCAYTPTDPVTQKALPGNEQPTLHWLLGCWHSAPADTQEFWRHAGDDYYFGHSVVRKEQRVVFFEQLRIRVGDNKTSLFAYPAGNGPHEFPALEQSADRIVFANDVHDFPQRIEYHRDGENLMAKISLLDGSRETTWSYARCSAKIN